MAKRHGPRTPVVLIVLDGWGFRPGREGNAVELGRTPTWHRLWANAPRTPVVLIVLDGWGFRPGREGNAVELGRTPTLHRLWANAPRTLLNASGLAVGLPEGQIGNSEVGHLNLGAGRVVPQDIVRISQSIESGEFFRLPPLVDLCSAVKRRGATLHLIGLIGNG